MSVKDSSESVVAKRHTEDCWPCRLVSGGGVVGIGAYLYNTGKKYPPGLNRYAIYALSMGKYVSAEAPEFQEFSNKLQDFLLFFVVSGAAGIGFARLLNLPPFNKKNNQHFIVEK